MWGRSDKGSRSNKAEDVLGGSGQKKNIRKAKGVKKNVIEKEITHEHYKEALFERKQFIHKMKILRSEGQEMYRMCMNKISVSPFDTKHWIADDGIRTRAYGHFRRAAAEY